MPHHHLTEIFNGMNKSDNGIAESENYLYLIMS